MFSSEVLFASESTTNGSLDGEIDSDQSRRVLLIVVAAPECDIGH